MTTDARKNDGIGKDIVIYICLLGLAALQFVIAYQNIDAAQMLMRMLVVAFIEAGLAALYFMHLGTEKRGFLLFVAVFTIAVLLGLQFGWTDSSRMLRGAPFSRPPM